MPRDENPPFDRGSTYYNGEAINVNDLGHPGLEGKEYTFEDNSPSNSFPSRGLGLPVVCRVVRNVSGIAILPRRLVTLSAAGFLGMRCDGYADVTAEGPVFPVDEYLPAAGVPNNDLFYVVVKGPALVKTSLAGNAENVIAVGDGMVALTGATSGATTSGRMNRQDLTGATVPLASQIQNRFGRAMSARTTANTDSDTLVLVGS